MEVAPPQRGLLVWYAVFGGVAAWAAHLLILTSLVRYSCNVPGTNWVMHLTTAVTAAMTVAAMGLSWRLYRIAGNADEEDASPFGRARFLGVVGLLVGGINLALILLEGAYVLVISPCLR